MELIKHPFWRSCVPMQRQKKCNCYSTRKYKGLPNVILFLSVICFTISLVPNNLIDSFPYGNSANSKGGKHEIEQWKDNEFDPSFPKRFNTVESFVYYVNKHTIDKDNKKEKLELLARLIRRRFLHAYAVYRMQDNWIAALAGRFIWKDLAAEVIPEDILQNEVAACSQVSIVIMECCKQLGINTRRVELVGHYCLEAQVADKWYFIDANLKPHFEKINGRKSLDKIVKNKEQFALYDQTKLTDKDIKLIFSKIVYGKVNEAPAPRAYIFHLVTNFLSHWVWLILFIIGAYYKIKSTNLNKHQYPARCN